MELHSSHRNRLDLLRQTFLSSVALVATRTLQGLSALRHLSVTVFPDITGNLLQLAGGGPP